MMTVAPELWYLVAYLTVGWLMMEAVASARKRWRTTPLRRGPMLLIWFVWPIILVQAVLMRMRGRNKGRG